MWMGMVRSLLLGLTALGLLATTAGESMAMQAEQGRVRAVPFSPGLPWLNISRPLSLEALRGKVVILDFWTYGCVNCMHVIPDLKKLERKYGNRLAVIGVHSPKFENEKNLDTLRNIVVRYDLEHPIVNDVDFTLWRSYAVRAWPTLVVIDPEGYVVGGVAGEGHYALLDEAVGELIEKFAGRLDTAPLPVALEKDRLDDSLLAAPGKVAVSEEYVAVGDTLHQRVLLADHEGKVQRIYGDGEAGLRDGEPGGARFSAPQGLAFGDGGLYVADTGNHVIRFIDLATQTVHTVAGSGEQGDGRVCTEVAAREAALRSPWGLAYRKPMLYIAMAGSHQIWRLDTASGRIGPYAGSGREDITDGTLAESTFSQPSGLSLRDNWLYVADAESSAVRRIDLDQGRVETLVGTGLFDFGDRDGDFKNALLQHVLGVAVLDDSRVLAADTYNHKLKLLDLEQRTVTTLAGTGKPGRGQGDARASGLNEPGGLAVLDGKVLIADTNNHRIAELDPQNGRLREWPLRP